MDAVHPTPNLDGCCSPNNQLYGYCSPYTRLAQTVYCMNYKWTIKLLLVNFPPLSSEGMNRCLLKEFLTVLININLTALLYIYTKWFNYDDVYINFDKNTTEIARQVLSNLSTTLTVSWNAMSTLLKFEESWSYCNENM